MAAIMFDYWLFTAAKRCVWQRDRLALSGTALH